MTTQEVQELTGYPSIDKPWMKYYGNSIEYRIPEGNLYDNLVNKTQDTLDKIAMRYNGLKISYASLFKNVNKVAEKLLEIGIQKKEIVSVCLPNIPEVVYLIFAINKIGAVGNMMDPRSGEDILEKQLIESKSRVLFAIDIISEKLSFVLQKTNVEIAVAVSAIDSFPVIARKIIRIKDKNLKISIPDKWLGWSDFMRTKYRLVEKCNRCMKSDDAFIAYTGGTTGVPKGVVSTNRNLCAVAEAEFIMGFDQDDNDSILDIAPPWTYYGLLNSLFAPLYMQLTVILVPKLTEDGLGKLVKKEKPNHIITVPSALTGMLSDECMQNEDLSYIHSVIVGADKLDESKEIAFNNFLKLHNANILVHKGYGMTEAMAATCVTQKNSDGIGSVGIPYLCNTVASFSIDSEEYIENQYGEVGEIAICGPSVMRGYFGDNSILNAEVLKVHGDGTTWLHTGDIGYVDEDGRVFIVGRIKRMFTRNGYKIFPATIEKSILMVREVSSAAVIAIPDIEKGNIIKAYLVTEQKDSELISQVKEVVKSQLYDYECPDIYEFIDKLPLTAMGKIDYAELEKMN